MAAKRNTRSKTVDEVPLQAQEEHSEVITSRIRAKKYTQNECDTLLRTCNRFHTIINMNSNRDSDRIKKENAWKNIKRQFDQRCKADGIYVSIN